MIVPDEDAWPYIAAELPHIVRDAAAMLMDWRGMQKQMEERYREGEQEYERDWLTRPVEWFDDEASQELADLLIYLAMRRFLVTARMVRPSGYVPSKGQRH
jgi:hypothetical protein